MGESLLESSAFHAVNHLAMVSERGGLCGS